MDSRTQERVERWDSRTFSGGYEELTTLANNGFSGAVTTGTAWLFMLNGRIVGVVDGTIDDFEHASGTIYAAPAPSLPLLCAMRTQGGSTRANYYTNETPLSEVDSTLQNGSFTGYVELSEQVLSGDYYAVYYGGRRMAAAYIGNSERLLTGEEAFERADDEVGIYEVVDVDIEVTDVPSTDEPAPGPSAVDTAESDTAERDAAAAAEDPLAGGEPDADDDAAGETGAATDAATAERESDPLAAGASDVATGVAVAASEPDSPVESESNHGASPLSAAESADASSTPAEATEPAVDVDPTPTEEVTFDADPGQDEQSPDDAADADEDVDPDPTADADEEASAAPDPAEQPATGADERTASGESASPDERGQAAERDDGEKTARFEQEEQWRETRRIPSIDPERSPSPTTDETTDRSGAEGASRRRRSRGQSASAATDEAAAGAISQAAGSDGAEGGMDSGGRLAALTEQLQQVTDQRDALAAKRDALEDDRETLQAKNRELTATIEQLRGRIESLEGQLEQERARSLDVGSGDGGGEQLSPERALPGTNLFVRYASKSDPTLDAAHDGGAKRREVASNLQLEHHTEFDADEVTVTGQSFESFLASTIEYQFVDWLTGTLLFEIRDTNHTAGLADLYDVIPRIDRVELHSAVSLDGDDEGPDEVSFDVVAFDKMGTPLVAVTFNESREPATEEMLDEIEAAASAVTAAYPDFGAAITVTTSYFDPGALEVAEEATKSGFLSRSSKQSYVTVSRKQGYHLCLVEARDGGFHLTIPEL